MRRIAALCVAKQSVYKTLAGVDCYDIDRDCRTFPGGMPVVAHPPCRAWSPRYAHFAKPAPGEKELAIWCVEKLKHCGGVLEHPAGSRLWSHLNLPLPLEGERHGFWSLAVDQSWWRFPTRKKTWLLFSGIDPNDVACPYLLRDGRGDGDVYERLSKRQRAATTLAFAKWLVAIARTTRFPAEIP